MMKNEIISISNDVLAFVNFLLILKLLQHKFVKNPPMWYQKLKQKQLQNWVRMFFCCLGCYSIVNLFYLTFDAKLLVQILQFGVIIFLIYPFNLKNSNNDVKISF